MFIAVPETSDITHNKKNIVINQFLADETMTLIIRF